MDARCLQVWEGVASRHVAVHTRPGQPALCPVSAETSVHERCRALVWDWDLAGETLPGVPLFSSARRVNRLTVPLGQTPAHRLTDEDDPRTGPRSPASGVGVVRARPCVSAFSVWVSGRWHAALCDLGPSIRERAAVGLGGRSQALCVVQTGDPPAAARSFLQLP